MTSSSVARDFFSMLTRIRVAEELAAKHYLENRIFSFVHFAIGQEIVAAAFGAGTQVGDHFIGNHRSHHHFLAKGGDARRMFAEMLGKDSGLAKGRGGSMHMFDPSIGFLGSSPILSSSIPIALGDAKARKDLRDGSVTVVFIGDGASEEGNFYECLNLAKLWSLPIVFVLEDNKYAVNSPASSRRPDSFSFRALAAAWQISFFEVDAAEGLGVLPQVEETLKVARSGSPAFLHFSATRFFAHSAPLTDDAAAYRVEDMHLEREQRDPNRIVRAQALALGCTEQELQSIESLVYEDLANSLSLAVSDSQPDVLDLLRGMYA